MGEASSSSGKPDATAQLEECRLQIANLTSRVYNVEKKLGLNGPVSRAGAEAASSITRPIVGHRPPVEPQTSGHGLSSWEAETADESSTNLGATQRESASSPERNEPWSDENSLSDIMARVNEKMARDRKEREARFNRREEPVDESVNDSDVAEGMIQTGWGYPGPARTSGVQNQASVPPFGQRKGHEDFEQAAETSGAALDWENLIGGKWSLWVGSFCLFLAIASFLAYKWDSLPPIPPWGRVALVLAAGFGFIGGGSLARGRAARWFSEGMTGAGLALLYLGVWAGAQYYEILPSPLALAAMIGTTGFGVWLALRNDAPGLNMLASIGGFLTPVLLNGSAASTVQTSPVPLLIYVAVLNAGILVVSLFKRWNASIQLSFAATVLLVWARLSETSGSDSLVAFGFVTLYFLMFMGAACFYSLARQEETSSDDLTLVVAATTAYALSGHALLAGTLGDWPGLFPLALCGFFAGLYGLTCRLVAANEPLRQAMGGVALFCLTVALPVQLRNGALTIGWSVEAAVLLVLGLRLGSPRLWQVGQLVWGLSVLLLWVALCTTKPESHWLFLNERALPLVVSVLSIAAVMTQSYRSRTLHPDGGKHALLAPMLEFMPLFAAYSVVAGACCLALETHYGLTLFRPELLQEGIGEGLYVIAVVWALFGYACVVAGMKVRDLSLRFCALVVVLLAAALPLWSSMTFSTVDWTPFWNLRVLSYAVVAVVIAKIASMMRRGTVEIGDGESEAVGFWPVFMALFLLGASSLEVYAGFEHWKRPSVDTWQVSAWMTLAMLWGSVGLGTLFAASVWKSDILRRFALLLSALSILVLLITAILSAGFAWSPFMNLRGLAFLMVAGLAAAASRVVQASAGDETSSSEPHPKRDATVLELVSAGVLLWGLTQETYRACDVYQVSLGRHWTLVAQYALSMVWSVFALGMLSRGINKRQPLHRFFAFGIYALALLPLCLTATDAMRLEWTPLFNVRVLAVAVVSAAGTVAVSWLRSNRDKIWDEEVSFEPILGFAVAAVPLIGLTQEAFDLCHFYRHGLGTHWERWAQVAISVAWSVYGLGLLIAGINRGVQMLRLAALGLLCATVLKVFLFDLSFLDAAPRILSLGALGAALVFISWLYGRRGNDSRSHVNRE